MRDLFIEEIEMVSAGYGSEHQTYDGGGGDLPDAGTITVSAPTPNNLSDALIVAGAVVMVGAIVVATGGTALAALAAGEGALSLGTVGAITQSAAVASLTGPGVAAGGVISAIGAAIGVQP